MAEPEEKRLTVEFRLTLSLLVLSRTHHIVRRIKRYATMSATNPALELDGTSFFRRR